MFIKNIIIYGALSEQLVDWTMVLFASRPCFALMEAQVALLLKEAVILSPKLITKARVNCW